MDLADVTVGDFLLNSVRASGFNLLSSKGAGLAGAVHMFMSTGLIVSITIKGILMMYGDMVATGKSLLKMAVWALVAIGITTPSIYANSVVIPLTELRDNLGVYLVSSDEYFSPSGIFEAISGSFNYMFSYAYSLVDKGGITNPTPILAGFVIGAVYGLYYFAITVNLVLCEIILSFLYILGMLIIPLSAFETLRGSLKSWFTLIVQYSLVVVCSSMFISILNNISMYAIENLASIKGSEGMLSPWMGLVLLVACFGMLVMKVAFDISAHLSGGMLGAGQDGMSSVRNAVGNVASTLRTGNMIRKGGLAAAKAAKQKIGG